ncbi:MAG: hypothetical protein ACRD4P_01445, partial [Bryobacteraceae bacterium]
MMKKCVWCLGAMALLTSSQWAWAQSCPPIAFYTAPAALTYDNTTAPGILKGGVRVMGRSYSEVDITLTPNYPLTVMPGFEQLFSACGFNPPGAASTRAKEPDMLG